MTVLASPMRRTDTLPEQLLHLLEGSPQLHPNTPETYKNGQPKHGVVDGIWTIYFIDGTVKATGPLQDDQMDGPWSFYRKTGELWQVGNFKRGVQDGSWVRYHRDGSVEKDVEFQDGVQVSNGR